MPRLTAAYTRLIVLLALLGAAPCAALAAGKATSPQEVEAALKEKKSAQTSLSQKSRQLEGETTGLQQKLVKTAEDLRRREESLAAGKKRLAELQTRKSALSEKLYDEQETVGSLVTAAQRFNRTSTPSLLAQGEPLEAARAARVMKTLIPLLHQQSASLRAEIAELEDLEQKIAAAQQAQQEALDKINAEEDKLNKLLAERRQTLRQTEEERAANEAEVARLTREAKNLEDLVARIERPRAKPDIKPVPAAAPERAATEETTDIAEAPVVDTPARRPGKPDAAKPEVAKIEKTTAVAAAKKGAAAPANSPVAGTVHTAFGATDDLGATSHGITYHADGNARVVTPLAGTVRFAGPFHKYKHILIIEHAGGYHSLIAGLGRVDTAVGAKLAAGEPVGRIDNNGADAHPVYYELRRNGTPVNPQKILVAQR